MNSLKIRGCGAPIEVIICLPPRALFEATLLRAGVLCSTLRCNPEICASCNLVADNVEWLASVIDRRDGDFLAIARRLLVARSSYSRAQRELGLPATGLKLFHFKFGYCSTQCQFTTDDFGL